LCKAHCIIEATSFGGYQVCQKWLKDRKGRALSYDDIRHYQKVVAALAETMTMTLMEQVDEVIEEYGGWPVELQARNPITSSFAFEKSK